MSRREKMRQIKVPMLLGSTIIRRENLFGFLLGASIFLALFLAVSWFRQMGPQLAEEPLVAFDPPGVDFGDILQKEVLRHEFRLVNPTRNNVQIIALRSTCSCTLVNPEVIAETIPPGESLQVPVVFDSGLSEGPVTASVEVLVESQGSRYRARTHITGNVNPIFMLEPRVLEFGNLVPGERATRTVTIHPGDLEENSILKVEASNGFGELLRTDLSRIDSDGFYQVTATFVAPTSSHSQIFGGTMDISTSSKRLPILRIPVRANVRPDLEVVPEMIVLQHSGPIEESHFTVRTLKPSRIIRVLAVTDQDADGEELPVGKLREKLDQSWDLLHRWSVNNALLGEATQIQFELEVQNGAERKEAWSLSVEIKRL